MKTDDPRERMGVYESFSDVPTTRRLERFAGSYEGRDTWADAVETWDVSEAEERRVQRCEESWKGHMAERGRHHALATPECCETWAAALLDEYAASTVVRKYWTKVQRFYHWLQWHAKHPHLYQPPLMAVVDYPDGAAAELWREQRGEVRRKTQARAGR